MIIAALLLLLLLLTASALLLPVGAQPTPPPGTPSVTVTVMPTATPAPTATPTTFLAVLDDPTWTNIVAFGRENSPWLVGLLVLVIIALGVLVAAGQENLKTVAERLNVMRPLFNWIDAWHTRAAHRRELDAGTQTYLEWVQQVYADLQTLPLERATRQVKLQLARVYVPLRVVEKQRIDSYRKLMRGDAADEQDFRLRREAFEHLQEAEYVFQLLGDPQPAQDDPDQIQPVRTEHLLLIGDAGSGKTTTLQYGALMLAQAYLQGDVAYLQAQLDLVVDKPLLPIYVRLTLFATTLPDDRQVLTAEQKVRYQMSPVQRFLEWLDGLVAEQISDCPPHLLSQHIRQGGCCLLLDGLDETGDERRRGQVIELIENLLEQVPGQERPNRFLIASRPFADALLAGFTERHLSPLNSDEAQLLLERWFNAVGAIDQQLVGSAEAQAQRLWDVVNSNDRLFEMATNPLLLTSMALLQVNNVGLPNDRAELYRRLIDLLLEKWRQKQKAIGNQLFVPDEAQLINEQRRLQWLALEMQKHELREVSLAQAQTFLRPHARSDADDDQADRHIETLLELLITESGLLQDRAGKYTFAHYTLQEYLAARAVDLLLDDQDRAIGVAFLFERRGKQRWRETILLAVGHWVGRADKPRQAQRLIKQLLDTGDQDDLLLAADGLCDALNVDDLRDLRATTATRLQELAFNPSRCPDPRTRNQAAGLLIQADAKLDQVRLYLRPAHDLSQV
jgi:hypothetical protein